MEKRDPMFYEKYLSRLTVIHFTRFNKIWVKGIYRF